MNEWTQPWKRWITAICDNRDGPWGYYAKLSKADWKGQKPYAFTPIWNTKKKQTSKQNKLIDTDKRWAVIRRKGEQEEGKHW